MPNAALNGLANNPLVEYISIDHAAEATLERTGATVGATAVRSQFGYDGSGITVAMLGESEQAFVERALDELGRMPIYDPDPPAEILAAIEDRMQNNTSIKLNLEGQFVRRIFH